MNMYTEQRHAIVRSVSDDQAELQRALEDLKSVARHEWANTRERLAVKHQIAEKPVAFMTGAFVVGLWLGWTLEL